MGRPAATQECKTGKDDIERGKRILDNVVLERCQKNFFRCLEEATAYERDGKVHRVLGRGIRKRASDTRNLMDGKREKLARRESSKCERVQYPGN